MWTFFSRTASAGSSVEDEVKKQIDAFKKVMVKERREEAERKRRLKKHIANKLDIFRKDLKKERAEEYSKLLLEIRKEKESMHKTS